MAKILCVLYPDPLGGYPPRYARDCIPVLRGYPDGQTLPTPEAIDFTPGELLGSVSGELGLRRYLEAQGHEPSRPASVPTTSTWTRRSRTASLSRK
jgi:formate dehydrogenase